MVCKNASHVLSVRVHMPVIRLHGRDRHCRPGCKLPQFECEGLFTVEGNRPRDIALLSIQIVAASI